jgi:hypothetical protein
MKPGMTYNQLKKLEKNAPTPVEYNPPDSHEFVPEMIDKTNNKVDQLRAKLMAVRAMARDKE